MRSCGSFCSFCGRCGRKAVEVIPTTKFCKYCRHENPIELSNCEECGKPLAEFFVSKVPKPKPTPPPGFVSDEEYLASNRFASLEG